VAPDRGEDKTEHRERRDGDSRQEIGMHAMIELDDVPPRRDGHEELAGRVGADGHGMTIDHRVPSGVIGLA
jgi:hypothetical protein